MARAAPRRAKSRRESSRVDAAYRNRTLEQMLRILCGFGIALGATRPDLRREFTRALAAATKSPYRMSEAKGFELFHGAGELIAAWYGQPALVDDKGQPQPLPLEGPVSVESLTRTYMPEYSAAEVIDVLLAERILVRLPNGLYRPVRRAAYVPRLNGLTMDRAAVLLSGLLTTMAWNHAGPKGRLKRLERQAHASHLPVDKIPEFEGLVKQLATLLATQVDVWMSSRQAAGSQNTRTARVGVHLFSYVEHNKPAVRARIKRERRA
jgi:hypothetical protein